MSSTNEITIRRTVIVDEDGSIRVGELPFASGQQVEITLRIPGRDEQSTAGSSILIGSVLHYTDPTAPVVDEDWESSH
jgi:hypothetical protein